MSLGAVLKFGYCVILVTMVLMIWASLARAREMDSVQYPPCAFNPLCSCSKASPDLGIVQCRHVPLPRIPPPINSSKVFMLHLVDTGLRNLEPYFLQATGLYRLEISRNPLSEVPDEAFLGLERSLWELQLQYNELTVIPSRALRHLQKLRLLDLTGNEISEIEPEDWRGLENSLQTLILSENSLTDLPPDAFSSLALLDTLDLRGNNLKDVDGSVFRDGMGRLNKILLADNQLTAIPYNQLSPLKQLRTLDLSYNHINQMNSPSTEPVSTSHMSLDTLRLDHNQITYLQPGAFQHFDTLNRTFLDGNPLNVIREDAFRQAKIRELSLRQCGLSDISPAAFGGLENSLQVLDLSGNNLTQLPQHIFHEFDFLRTLSLKDNEVKEIIPGETFNGFQYTLFQLDLSGQKNGVTSLQDLRRMRNLRSLSLTRLPQPHIAPEDFLEFGVDLEELRVTRGRLKTVKAHAFMHVRGLKRLDLSENDISYLEPDAFTEVGHSLMALRISHGLSGSVNTLPSEALRHLTSLTTLDLSNNRIRNMPDTSFHFLKKLRRLELQDNQIEQVHKGTFQGDIHSGLEEISLSFNNLKSIAQHSFVDLSSLQRLHLDDNHIEKLERRAFMNMDRLKRLNLRGNKLRYISEEAFQNLPELEWLDLAYNALPVFDFPMFDQVGTLGSLSVNASHNRINEIQTNNSGFGMGHESGGGFYHSNIKVLDLSHNNISRVGRGFFRPVEISLTHLYLGYNSLQNASRDVFGNMPHLQWLDLSNNLLGEIDFDAFRNTKRLQVLHLPWNGLHELPAEVFRFLENLRVVDISHNALRMLPDNLFPQEGMESLDVSHNQLSRMPMSSLSPSSAATLCELDLSWNIISSIHSGDLFGRLRSLSWLDLSYNRLVRLDDGIFSSLPRLSSIELSHNCQLALEPRGRSFQGLEYSLLDLGLDNVSLSAVPDLPLPSLRNLRLAHNELPSVPPEMSMNMTSLRKLDLSYNDLTTVPLVTHSLPQLRSLSLAGNPITTLTNTSLLGVADTLEELDITKFALNVFETGALGKMHSLRRLYISAYHGVRDFSIPRVLEGTGALRDLWIEASQDTDLSKEMQGPLPYKLKNITFSGSGIKNIASDALKGVRSPHLNIALRNTSTSKISQSLFRNVGWARNLTVDVRNNSLQHLPNPSSSQYPGVPMTAFLTDVRLAGNRWTCDCEIGWVEVWHRKKRQFLCDDNSDTDEWPMGFGSDCRHAPDDVRIATCNNKNNASLIEILKSELECGWGSTAPVARTPLGPYLWALSIGFLIYL